MHEVRAESVRCGLCAVCALLLGSAGFAASACVRGPWPLGVVLRAVCCASSCVSVTWHNSYPDQFRNRLGCALDTFRPYHMPIECRAGPLLLKQTTITGTTTTTLEPSPMHRRAVAGYHDSRLPGGSLGYNHAATTRLATQRPSSDNDRPWQNGPYGPQQGTNRAAVPWPCRGMPAPKR